MLVAANMESWKLCALWLKSYTFWVQVSSRLTDLEATLDAGIRHRNKALASVGVHLAQWMNMVRVRFCMSSCLRCFCSLL